jgi:hypothetical protein
LIWFCLKYEIFWNMQVGLIISAIVFPLAFSINESYRRRERVCASHALLALCTLSLVGSPGLDTYSRPDTGIQNPNCWLQVLDEMATFMGAASELYWLHRDWTLDSGLPESHPQDVEQDVRATSRATATDCIHLIHLPLCTATIVERIAVQC